MLERPLVLVLDDLHALANRSCLDALAELFEYVPAGSKIAVASREQPALPLARWRAHGLVDEIGVADLRLDDREAGLLLEAAGVELDASALSELNGRTEGWPAGLYLAALSMQAGAPSSASAVGLTGDDRFVAEYFHLELLSRLPATEARFLKHTSVLDRMCGGLCDSVAADDPFGRTARDARAYERLRRAARSARQSGIAITTCSASCCGASSSAANLTRRSTQRPGDGLVHRERPDRRGSRLRARCG